MPLPMILQYFNRPNLSDITSRVTVSASGAEANGDSYYSVASPNGRYVVFESKASNLVIGDNNGYQDVFLKDTSTGAVTRLSTGLGGAEANNLSARPRFSPDGRYVLFESTASNLVAGDTNGVRDVFCKDLVTGAIFRVSESASGVQADASSSAAQFSANGRYVIFESDAHNLSGEDTGNSKDIFRKDLVTGEIVCISKNADGAIGDADSQGGSVSPDGRYVLFESRASNLVAGDTNGVEDIFLKDLATGVIKRVSVDKDGAPADAIAYGAQLSADGRYAFFTSAATNLVDGDTNNANDIFRKDLVTGDVIRVSVAQGGAQANGGSYDAVISADGRYVVFHSSATNLVAGDTNGTYDVFRKDLLTGEVIRLNTADDGTQANDDAEALLVTADGRYVSFLSYATNLVTGDTNGTGDIFLVDAVLVANRVAVADGRFVDLRFGVGDGARVSVAWGDGIIDTLTPVNGSVNFTHAFATKDAKAVVATVEQFGQSWSVPYLIDLASNTMTRDTAREATLSGSAGNDQLDGDDLANLIIGNDGNDVLNGGAGADRMYGGAGNDTYYVDSTADVVDDASGTDTVYTFINYTLGSSVDALRALGSAGLALTGNAFANTIYGNEAKNTIKGGSGNDTIAGGYGNDTLYGQSGKDVFVFDTRLSKYGNVDKIADYSVKYDTIRLENAIFTKLKAGKLKSSAFWTGAKAHDKDDRIIYDSKKGYLYYDADGTNAKYKQVLIATMSKNLKMVASEFYVI